MMTKHSSDMKLSYRTQRYSAGHYAIQVILGHWFWTNQKPECEFLLVNNTNLILSGIIWQY